MYKSFIQRGFLFVLDGYGPTLPLLRGFKFIVYEPLHSKLLAKRWWKIFILKLAFLCSLGTAGWTGYIWKVDENDNSSHSHRKTLLMPAHHRNAHGLNASWAIRTRIFLMRTRIFLMRTCIYSFSRTSLPHLTWVNRSTGAHFTLFLLGHKVGRQKILSLRSMLAMHTWICTFSHALHLTRD